MENNFKCDQCIYLNGRFSGTCAAFPKGIPIEIGCGRISHTTPYEGDNGIQFESVEENK